jgi:hypothetical protein
MQILHYLGRAPAESFLNRQQQEWEFFLCRNHSYQWYRNGFASIGAQQFSRLPLGFKRMSERASPADGHVAEDRYPLGKGWVRAEHAGKDLSGAQGRDDEQRGSRRWHVHRDSLVVRA